MILSVNITEGLNFKYRLKNYNINSMSILTQNTTYNPNMDNLMDYLNNAGKDNIRLITDIINANGL